MSIKIKWSVEPDFFAVKVKIDDNRKYEYDNN